MRSDSGVTGPPKSRHAGAGPVLQILQPDQHVHMRAVPAALGQHRRRGVVEHIPAHIGQRLGLPLPGAAVVLGGQRRGMGVDHRGDRVEHRRIVEPALHLPPAVAASRVRNSSFTRAGGRSSGCSPSWSSSSTSAVPQAAARAGCTGRPSPASCASAPGPGCGREPPGRLARRAPWRSPRRAANPSAPPRTPPPSPATGPAARAPSNPVRGVTCSAAVTRRRASNRSQPSRSLNACNRRLVTALGEHPVAVQPGNRGHGDLIQLPRQSPHTASEPTPARRRARRRHAQQRIDRLHKQALRGSERALGHAYIFASTTDNSGASATIPSKISREVRATTSLASCRTRQTNNARFHPPDTPAAEPPRLASVTRAPPRRPRRSRRSGRRRAGSRAGSRSPRPARGCGRRGSR